jgi:hypothetical protein
MRARSILLLLSLLPAESALTQDKPTSISDARSAVELNLSTAEGKTFDEQLGTEFVQKHLGELRRCKQNMDDRRSFWIVMKLAKDGSAKEVLLYPETKIGRCAREALLRENFLAPPRAAYWVSIYIKLAA